MDQLQARAVRRDFSFPVQLLTDEGLLHGHCVNISESGLFVNFSRPPEIWSKASLEVRFAAEVFSIPVRVARVQDRGAGLCFRFRDDTDRLNVGRLVAFAAANTSLTERPPF